MLGDDVRKSQLYVGCCRQGTGNHPSCVVESKEGVESKPPVAHTCLLVLFRWRRRASEDEQILSHMHQGLQN